MIDIQEMPHSEEAEKAVLGAIFCKPPVITKVIDELTAMDFYRTRHQILYQGMADLYEKGDPIDLVTITSHLQEKKALDNVGGVPYITELVSYTPTAENIDYYAGIVLHKARRRKLIEINYQVYKDSLNNENVDEVLAQSEKLAAEIRERGKKRSVRPIREVALEAYEEIDRTFQQRGRTIGVTSGYPDLDKMTSGFHKQDLIILAARPSIGKTALALNIAQNASKSISEPIMIFSLEMSAGKLVTRMVCAEGNIDASKLRSGWLEGDDWIRLTHALGIVSKTNIYIDDTPEIALGELRSKCRSMKQQEGLGLVIIDYLTKIRMDKPGRSREQEVSEIARTLKSMARELEVPVIALSQLSRGVEQRQDKRPMMSDLRESGQIEQEADLVAFLYRDDYYDKATENKNILEVIIAKQRNGPIGTVELAFLKEFNKFVSLDHRFGKQQTIDDEPEERDTQWRQ
ncbi:probable replicative DNA helicase [Brevibacillus brevis NBRC 100599]|uniref:Replicative DNA helicase n=1 Tax=Brevibacillus brevis (strain 47 / JCM 6285 / NBRC 100599) TaxID=358681 RepID=C0Z716_BREBN|nr:replicative DNA helicase [Brevibacillus brevis]BAH43883.1 probable replicative DNA helicase [Brevibacillus brevis NBRC 100599]BAH46365.1 probable replicative DNA helicase [Brevibacillus brevis NBRC 100599]